MRDSDESTLADLINSKLLQSFCRPICFEPGAVLRRKGHHYREMYLLTHGCVDIDRGEGRGAAKLVSSGVGSPIGEIGFLRGSAAIATVTARTPTSALVIDDPSLARLEREQPAMTARLLRGLAEVAEERTSYNLVLTPSAWLHDSRQAVDVHLCRSKEMLESAQQLRYQVYCRELSRRSPHADHEREIISDHLDETGHTFIAVEAGETIGTLRGNISSDCSLGILEELYGMRKSAHHPEATCIATKFVIKRSHRGGAAAMKLISAIVRYGLRHQIKDCYIDSIPALIPYYRALGFTIAGEKFLHRENGPSHPMVIDFTKHGERLSESGMVDYWSMIMKAQVIKLISGARSYPTSLRQRE